MRQKLLFVLIASLYANHAFADISSVNVSNNASLSGTSDNYFFPLMPRASLWAGTGNNTYGRLDAMIPLFGSPNGIVFTDIDGQKGSHDTWYGSAGLGIRDAVNDDMLWGAYGFIDRSQTEYGNHWEVFNPGIEMMTKQWDGRINGYFPVGNATQKTYTGTYFGDQITNDPTLQFQQHFQYHTQYSQQFNVYQTEEVPKGMDADVGYTFSDIYNIRAHAGAYYFGFSDNEFNSIQGIEGGIEFPVNQYSTLALNDSYDKTNHNTAVVSVRFDLGGIDKQNDGGVSNRILDPIYRHLGALRTNSGMPTEAGQTADVLNNGAQIIERDNIWFFRPTGGSTFNSANGTANCTYENPCSGSSFTQTNVNAINTIASDANLYFTPGAYGPQGSLDLNSGQSMYGRTSDYRNAASTTSGYPIFTGTLLPLGNNILDSFAITGAADGNSTIGVDIENANNIQMNNLVIDGTYVTPLQINNAQNITLTNSSLYTARNHSVLVGISSQDSTVEAEGNTITVASVNDDSVGVSVSGGTFTLNNSTVNVSANYASSTPGEVVSLGVYADNGTVNLNNNNFNVSQIINGSTNAAVGIVSRSPATINAGNNVFTLTNTTTNGIISGAFAESGNINLTNNVFNLGQSASATGLVTITGTITSNSNTFDFTGSGIKTCKSGSNINSSGDNFTGGCT